MNGGHLDKLLAHATDSGASDLHIIAGVPAAFRINGDIIFADEDALSIGEVTEMAFSLLSVEQRDQFTRGAAHACPAAVSSCSEVDARERVDGDGIGRRVGDVAEDDVRLAAAEQRRDALAEGREIGARHRAAECERDRLRR